MLDGGDLLLLLQENKGRTLRRIRIHKYTYNTVDVPAGLVRYDFKENKDKVVQDYSYSYNSDVVKVGL